ncbi:hypothetical protein [Polyangium sorediatum]|uniref:Uncharacterized protein n=1 Tax=Polyangium sorediatum TaxID=889274 RepID=A0ABT6NT54_9BACT|nr:hypothetical protein [Polyangium sorediatum]MDI1431458.1 hypothetical protein [Polyangium sorediatum]
MKSILGLVPLLLLPLATACSGGDVKGEGEVKSEVPAELSALCERLVICQGLEQQACEAEGMAGIKAALGVKHEVCDALIEADLAMYGCLAKVEDCETFNTATQVADPPVCAAEIAADVAQLSLGGFACYSGETPVPPPPEWTCNALRWNGSDGCDCGCGAPDPDCDGAGSADPGTGVDNPACDACFGVDGKAQSCISVTATLEAAGFLVTPAGKTDDGAELYDLTLLQQNDHQDATSGTHEQYLTLIHRGFDRPMNLISTGYSNYLGFDQDELTTLLGGNQLVLDKRFHNGNGDDYAHFSRKQVADDAHDVVVRLHDLYKSAWIGSGFSNGGVDMVSFRQHYPNDVDATVAFGAPFMVPDDTRFLSFFDTVDATCQDRLEAIQHAALGAQRTAVEPAVHALAAADLGDTFTRVEPARAFEAAALSYPWLFWQYFGTPDDCTALPDPATATAEELTTAFFSVTSIFGTYPMSDGYLSFFGAYFYEVQRSSGWPALPRAALVAEGLIPEDLVDMERGLVPEGVTAPEFDAAENSSLAEFARLGDGIAFVYSDHDPWVAGAVTPDAGSGNVRFTVTNGNHTATFSSLSEPDQAALSAFLEEKLGIDLP